MKEKSGNLTVYREDSVKQCTNARKGISEGYAFICTEVYCLWAKK